MQQFIRCTLIIIIISFSQLLPRYQDAHERAVFKAAAMVKETKQVLAELDHQGLADLRSMQKPDSDVEDVLAAVIIIGMLTDLLIEKSIEI